MTQTNERPFTKDFGDFILRGRLNKGLTQAEIAEKIGITQSYYAYIEQGKKNIYLDIAMRICNCLDLSLEDFVALRHGAPVKKEEGSPTQQLTDDIHPADSVDPDQIQMDEYLLGEEF